VLESSIRDGSVRARTWLGLLSFKQHCTEGANELRA